MQLERGGGVVSVRLVEVVHEPKIFELMQYNYTKVV